MLTFAILLICTHLAYSVMLIYHMNSTIVKHLFEDGHCHYQKGHTIRSGCECEDPDYYEIKCLVSPASCRVCEYLDTQEEVCILKELYEDSFLPIQGRVKFSCEHDTIKESKNYFTNKIMP
ncbi:hypothetical protein ILUMI_26037 [Ignelater luminosus]|uniref:TNFR-Cys domain-containing protein n=1 Tax=Ignelater luminosus TaxID=2038154 RepID=A0A8K0FZC0_IGNLU|nr:hypothetical protein ILUMI_26037 [Ignelater luminosus]